MQNKQAQQIAEDMQRSIGQSAQKQNFFAAYLVAETLKSTLGPKGMDKMIVDTLGDVLVTNDGVTILSEMQIDHPAARMFVEIAKTQEEEVGDGTTTAVVLAGELLKRAEHLLAEGVHPTVIVKGYHKAYEKCQDIMPGLTVKGTDVMEDLKKIAMTAMTGKGAEASREKLAEMLVEAVDIVINSKKRKGIHIFSRSDIKIESRTGKGINESEVIKGLVMDKEKVHHAMPDVVNDAKVMLLNQGLEIKDTETEARIQITDPNQIQAFAEQEEKMLMGMVESIGKTGANVLFCQKNIDEVIQYMLAKKRIFTVRHVKARDMARLARATGATVANDLKEVGEADLGKAGAVGEWDIGNGRMVFVKECENPKTVTILLRGGTEHVVSEIERAMEDAIGDIQAFLRNKEAVAGAGAFEIELSKRLRKYANDLPGREQLAFNSFTDSLEVIPKTLAENAGLDRIDMLTKLRAEHEKDGGMNMGLDVHTGDIRDVCKLGIIEPLDIKKQAIGSATEVVEMILRIDDVITGKDPREEEKR